ncbi:hypothetical protein HCN44_005783 [Aphidius gifuensis]|uniref:Uncharacterized protein n=1 Tax=Aphidius gifuensis TaxID=684658 RepID=A0A835CR77_APHGI|nr:hypothetical protein HCN44_005783 [Aphidius gifuensis]
MDIIKFDATEEQKVEDSLEKFNRLSYLTLRHFELDEITMQEINQKNTLVNLDLTGCSLRNSFDISNLRRLESLTLEWVAGVDTVLTASIAIGCGNLKYLNMTNCSTVTETALQEIAKLENLEKLIISNVSMAQDDMFEQFFQLKYLDCFGCCDITDVGLKKVLEKCSMLEYLDATETGATIETIKTAATMTKYRQNDIILEITLSSSVVEEYNSLETIVTSNYLKIVTSKEGNIEPGEYGEPDNVGVQKIDWYHDEDDFDDCCEIDDDGFELY